VRPPKPGDAADGPIGLDAIRQPQTEDVSS